MDINSKLTEREAKILRAVVKSYITSAEPVGSRTVVKRFDLGLSPATVRNVMADLEESGFLMQLHTSSGRVPTGQGYRYYVDYLMNVQQLTLTERSRIENEYATQLNDADEVLRHTSHLLALITNQAGMAEAPDEGRALVQHLELMPLAPSRVVVLVVDNFGRVRSMTANLDNPITVAELSSLNRFLNEHLHGVAIDNLVTAMEDKLQSFMDEHRQLAARALDVLQLLPIHRPGQLYLEGATRLFEQPEFRDIAKAREVFGLLEERDEVVALMRAAATGENGMGSLVLIGGKAGESRYEDISVVASPYRVNGEPVGVIGVLGPRRMPYSRLTAIVDYTANMVGRILSRLGS
jgi:heat-inducible transcriptional repressor